MALTATIARPLRAARGGEAPVLGRARNRRRGDDGEARLATSLAGGDPDALERVYELCGRVTLAYLLRTLRDRGVAEDVQQQVFLEVWQRRSSYDPARGSLLTWVMTIARSRAIDQLRRRVPEPAGMGAELEPADAAGDDAEALAERYRVAGLLSRLHPEEAEVLRLRFYEDLTQPEIAERTGIALGTVKMRMVSALKRLRTMIEEDER